MLRMSFPTVLICALILSCFCSRVSSLDEKISVIQSPDNIAVTEGESANITCCWTTMTKEIFNVKVGWFKNETRVSAENRLYQKSPSQNCSTLHITHITPNDAGEYMCKVTQDIPILREYNGSKTHLTVIQIHVTTEDSVLIISDTSSMVPVTICVPTVKKPQIIQTVTKSKTNPKDETALDGHSVDSSNESGDLQDIVFIYIFRCLPFLTLLVAFFYLNRDDKRAIPSKTDKPSKPLEQPEEDLESGNKCRNDTESVKQGERETAEKPEDEKDKQEEENEPVVLLDTEDVMVIRDSEEGAASLVNSIVATGLSDL
ncbi:uncharacterized protein LOC130570719 isoform X2 [Triplophysa rosa]|uniref:uncharacterized protein LOC130570719 isoform X2 n=2 Tax=Triplophysa rosa TaxID=992332 RepID=UPI00254610A4|nr:uncharacterized protein LOC130570719 isoform X2 [Triplophysa rosa]